MQTGTKQKQAKGHRHKSRKSVDLNKIASHSMRQHLMLNQQRLYSSDAIAKEFDQYCEALEEFNREGKEQPGIATPVKGGDEKDTAETEKQKTRKKS